MVMQTGTTLESTLDKTLKFLRRYGRLAEGTEPVFSEPYFQPGMDPHFALRAYGVDEDDLQYLPIRREGDYAHEAFKKATEDLPLTTSRDLERRLLALPDSDEFALVDIGSGVGSSFTNEFSQTHPRVSVVMVDHLTPATLRDDGIYHTAETAYGRWVGFEKRVPPSDDVEQTMNQLLDANGLGNARYVQQRLQPNQPGQLTPALRGLKGKRLIFTGFRNPAGLGTITLDEMQHHHAELAVVTMSALERIPQLDATFARMTEYLQEAGLTNTEINAYHRLLHNPTDTRRKKYDRSPEQQRFGIMLKQLWYFLTAHHLDKTYTTEIMRIRENGPIGYNQPAHALYTHHKEKQPLI